MNGKNVWVAMLASISRLTQVDVQREYQQMQLYGRNLEFKDSKSSSSDRGAR